MGRNDYCLQFLNVFKHTATMREACSVHKACIVNLECKAKLDLTNNNNEKESHAELSFYILKTSPLTCLLVGLDYCAPS